jgi:hypothetical protein
MEKYFDYLEKLAGLNVVDTRLATKFLETRFNVEPNEAEDIVLIWLLSRKFVHESGTVPRRTA